MWITCALCGALVAAVRLHADWHDAAAEDVLAGQTPPPEPPPPPDDEPDDEPDPDPDTEAS